MGGVEGFVQWMALLDDSAMQSTAQRDRVTCFKLKLFKCIKVVRNKGEWVKGTLPICPEHAQR